MRSTPDIHGHIIIFNIACATGSIRTVVALVDFLEPLVASQSWCLLLPRAVVCVETDATQARARQPASKDLPLLTSTNEVEIRADIAFHSFERDWVATVDLVQPNVVEETLVLLVNTDDVTSTTAHFVPAILHKPVERVTRIGHVVAISPGSP